MGRIGNKHGGLEGEKRCEGAEVLWFCGRNKELLGRVTVVEYRVPGVVLETCRKQNS